MNLNEIRKKDLEKNISRQYKLLSEYEKIQSLSTSPKEVESANEEIPVIRTRLEGYINEYRQICEEEGVPTPTSVMSIWRELQTLKKGQEEIISKQDETLLAVHDARNAILQSVSLAYRDTMQVLLSALDEQEIQIVQMIIEDADDKQIPEVEMTRILQAIEQGQRDLQKKGLVIFENDHALQEAKKLRDAWNSPDISTSGLFKLTVPIIPTILTYETELRLDVKESLKDFWRKFRRKKDKK